MFLEKLCGGLSKEINIFSSLEFFYIGYCSFELIDFITHSYSVLADLRSADHSWSLMANLWQRGQSW